MGVPTQPPCARVYLGCRVEYTYNYHADDAHAQHWARFPTPDQQHAFARAYVEALSQQLAALRARQAAGTGAAGQVAAGADGEGAAVAAGIALAEAILGPANGGAGGGEAAAEAAAELLVKKALAYATLTHLKWSLWGLIQVRARRAAKSSLPCGPCKGAARAAALA